MPVLRDLANEITRALNIPELKVSPFSRSSANIVLLLQGAGQAFFAKIFTNNDLEKLDANIRYDREKAILTKPWPVGIPKLVYAADVQRVLVTREVVGFGFKHYIDSGEVLEAMGMMAQWLAGFHAAAEVQPMEGTLWDDFVKYAEFRNSPGFDAHKGALMDYPLKEYVLSKGDATAVNFKFKAGKAIALDFEGVAFRAKEYDLVALIQGLNRLTNTTIADMVDTVVTQYAKVRPIDDPEATKDVINRVLSVSDY
jgi:hypothetical protein